MKADACSSCSHSDVCMYKTTFEEAQKEIEKVLAVTTVSSILKPVKVECKYYNVNYNLKGGSTTR